MSGDDMTVDEFIAWALALPDPRRWELHDGRPARRPGSWMADGLAKTEALVQLMDALEDDPKHEVVGFGPLLVTGERTAVEPHLVVVPRNRQHPEDVVLHEPFAVVELPQADGTARHWLPRLRAYAMLPTVRHVVAVHAAARTAVHLRREADGTITGRVLRGGSIALDPLPVALDLDGIWARPDRRAGG